jgi:hypothetical protein
MSSPNPKKENPFVGAGCDECKRLLDAFGEAVTEVVALHKTHFLAVVQDEMDPHRFDLLIHDANEKKQNAKYAYLLHRETHDCSLNINEIDAD